MKRKQMNLKIGIIIFLLLGQLFRANMSSPVWEGTRTSSAISSKDINILSEKIVIKIAPDFKTAKFVVEYHIQSEQAGRKIPLLFFAQDYKDNFSVRLDDKSVQILEVPAKHTANSEFSSFSNSLKKGDPEDEISIYWQKNVGQIYRLSELKYFETDITKGTHTIKVEYTAKVWTDISGWIKEFSFRYSLTPAKYWKSFGSLEVIVEQEGKVKSLQTNLGSSIENRPQASNTWKFNKLPAEFIEISMIPKPARFVQLLISINPFGFAFIALALLAIIHLILIISYRRKNIDKKVSLVVILGSFLVPILALLVYIFSFDLIDNAIGENAGKHHGYVFLSFFLYPVILLLYWLLMWIIDKSYKRKLLNKR